ncbi:3-oxoacyl-[acyl-carrier-protein] synthase 2 [Piscirickettsia salmonis]|uniref:beta-ketoacyl-ACP synthase II n=1 Tax=Piscirickettsia salmonis TaxID=1238 RepID=UPI0012BAAE81|nr:beta-ketoacyl-ACP synthase II [Piscirickettsia salmonis]QGP53611.1 3-oxoacyl-[acyl-carrier-protein] synthase 2 [Piscirickettsia salmonis]QGP60473.1 3-oxoacyl-[acyl-carrier-protein] synthase 2 [Piscirickettsia salmonis]QGP63182.1 3-oxoacyl-[acyl-carrier-protein] synthase 2 [Piscirickettsia salmonis]
MSKRRVVVTGLGMVSPLGLTVQESWDGILAGKSGVRAITSFGTDDLSTKIAATVEGFDSSAYISPKDAKKMDLFIQYGMVASDEAIADAGLEVTEENASRIGVAVGSGIGGLGTIETAYDTLQHKGARRVSPFFIPGSIINMISGNLSIKHGFKGPNIAIVTACTTGTHNLGYAARTIAYGDADVMIAGGAEKAVTSLGISGFAAARALSKRNDDPVAASRPWDKDRDGFILGDGAAVVVLEEYEHAKKRGATIYAELAGFGVSADAYHMTLPDGVGGETAMRNALADAQMNPEQIQYVNAHGTSTPAGDQVESAAIERLFGTDIKVSSTKSMTGHLIAAAGSAEAIFSILAIRDQVAPPTINLDNVDEGCNLDYIPHSAREMKIEGVVSNSFGFGGTNGTLLFNKV